MAHKYFLFAPPKGQPDTCGHGPDDRRLFMVHRGGLAILTPFGEDAVKRSYGEEKVLTAVSAEKVKKLAGDVGAPAELKGDALAEWLCVYQQQHRPQVHALLAEA